MNNRPDGNIKDSERDIYNKGYGKDDIMPDPKIMQRILAAHDEWMDERLKRLPVGARILDIGCGAGNTSIALAERGFSVVGIDLSDVRIEAGRKEAARCNLSNIEFQIGDAEYPPFKKESFDGVYCNAILHHLPDVQGDIRRYWELLRPGGQIFALEPGLLNPFAFIRRQFFPTSVHTPDEKPFVPHRFISMFRKHFNSVEAAHYDITNLVAPITEKIAGKTIGNIVLNVTYPTDRVLCKIPGIREFAWYLAVWARKEE